MLIAKSVFILLVCIVAVSCSTQKIRSIPSFALVDYVRGLDDVGYLGGIDDDLWQSTEEFASLIIKADSLKTMHCEDYETFPEEFHDNDYYKLSYEKMLDKLTPNVRYLVDILKTGNNLQKDFAAITLGKVGPGIHFIEYFLTLSGKTKSGGRQFYNWGKREGWLYYAAELVQCENYGSPSYIDIIPFNKYEQLLSDKDKLALFLADLFSQDNLHFPEDMFSESFNLVHFGKKDNYREEGLVPATTVAIPEIVEILTDDKRSNTKRIEAANILYKLNKFVSGYGGIIERAYLEATDEELRWAIGAVLISSKSQFYSKVFADRVRSDELYWRWRDINCELVSNSIDLQEALIDELGDKKWENRVAAGEVLTCFSNEMAENALEKALNNNSHWSLQKGILMKLRGVILSPQLKDVVKNVSESHWSKAIRNLAVDVLNTLPPPDIDEFGWCFHGICPEKHLQDRCGKDEFGDGIYEIRGLGQVKVQWIQAKKHKLPRKLKKMIPQDFRPDYGSNTLFTFEDGWLVGTDLWHYDGGLWFVDKKIFTIEAVRRFDTQFIIDSPFGLIIVAKDILNAGESSLIYQIERKKDGSFELESLLQLPSVSRGYKIIDHRLFMMDLLNVYEVTKDFQIKPISCVSLNIKE